MEKLWLKICEWVMSWPQTVFVLVTIAAIALGLLCIMGFVKDSYTAKKDKKLKWGKLVLFILFAIIVVLVCCARFAQI